MGWSWTNSTQQFNMEALVNLGALESQLWSVFPSSVLWWPQRTSQLPRSCWEVSTKERQFMPKSSTSFANTGIFLLSLTCLFSPDVFPQELNFSLSEVLSLPVWRWIGRNCVPVRLMWARILRIIAQRVMMMRSGAVRAGGEPSHEACLLPQP